MDKRRKFFVFLLIAVLAASCMILASCNRNRVSDDSATGAVSVKQKTDEEDKKDKAVTTDEKNKKDKTATTGDKDKKDKTVTKETNTKTEQKTESVETKQSEAENTSTKGSSAGKSSHENNSNSKSSSKSSEKKKKAKESTPKKTAEKPKEKQKVWVEPVTETRTVELDTGTRYCNGANSNGGCGASWHGTKDSTYSSWKTHWQDYVKKRTKEEAEKGNTYVCDHIHDDSRWEADTGTETVVVEEGYWKEVD